MLVLVAHPDDAELGMAMRLAHLAQRGAAVHVHCFSSGAPDVAERRLAECLAAGAVLGVRGYTFGELPENHLGSRTAEVNDVAYAMVSELRPASVFTHVPDDQHPDHVAVGRAVTAVALREVPHVEHFRSPYTQGFRPNRTMLADEGLFALRQKALACFASQRQLPVEALEAAVRYEHYGHVHHRVVREIGEPRYGEQFVLVREVGAISSSPAGSG